MINRFRAFSAAAAMMLVPAIASAQAPSTPAFGKGSRVLSLGVMTGGDYEGFGAGGSFEVGTHTLTNTLTLGLGGMVGFVRDSENSGVLGGEFSVTQIPIMAIGNVHLALPNQPKLDLYGGVSLGIISARVSYDSDIAGVDDSASESDFGIGIQVGARYAATPRFQLFGQLGVNDIPLLFAGVSFKL